MNCRENPELSIICTQTQALMRPQKHTDTPIIIPIMSVHKRQAHTVWSVKHIQRGGDVLVALQEYHKQEILWDFSQISLFMWCRAGSSGLAANM